jgi:sugar transferase (PEP-CTERM system associated)
MLYVRIFGHYIHTPYLLMAAAEGVIVVAAAYLGFYLRYQSWPGFWAHAIPAGSFAFIIIVAMLAMGVYESRIREGFSGMMLRTAVAVFLLGALATAVLSYLSQMLFMSRGALLLSSGTAFVLIALWRWFAFSVVSEEALKRRVVVLGTGRRALKVASRMRRKSDQRAFVLLGYLPVGSEEPDLVSGYGGYVHRGDLNLLRFCQEHRVEEIVVAVDERRRGEAPDSGLPLDDLIECRMSGVHVCDVQVFVEREACKVDIDLLRPGWLAFADGFVMRTRHKMIKRTFDLIAAVGILALAWPVMLAVAACIRLETRGPAIYRQERVGRGGRVFRLMKFRSMFVSGHDDEAGWTRQNDPRITRVGSFIRKTRLDEFPQLFNVLRGDMSFVGPRPERPVFVEQLKAQIPYYDQRHRVKPGITGWAQLCYPYGASVDDSKEKLQYDLYYLKNQSLMLDLIILLQTVEVVLVGEGAR